MMPGDRQRPLWVRALVLIICMALIAVLIGLGNWQMRRLAWKLDLIEAVDTRAFGSAVPLPAVFQADQHAYLRVTVSGEPGGGHVLVKAVTELGPGHWVMAPLVTEAGIVWVNRGFVPPAHRDPDLWSAMPATIEGLLRATEPEGTLLERNDPGAGRWVSRDVAAMSRALGLGAAAPFFVDADHSGPPDAWPRGGMTIIRFRNTHLSYALTWYAMAALFGAAVIGIYVRGRRA